MLPMLLLVVSVVNTALVTQEKVARQTAADASALAAAAVEARALNAMSAVNVTQTYILAEAMAEQSFLNALDFAVPAAKTEYGVLQTACGLAVFGGGFACVLAPIAKVQWQYLQKLQTAAHAVLPWLCARADG